MEQATAPRPETDETGAPDRSATKVEVEPGDFPDPLLEQLPVIDRCLNQTPPPAKFPEASSYPTAPDVERLARDVLIPQRHPHLEGVELAYVYRERLTSRGEVSVVKVVDVPNRYTERFGVDYFVDVNWDRWTSLGAAGRVRWLDFALAHLIEEQTADGPPEVVKRSPQVSTFVEVVALWGPAEGAEADLIRAVQGELDL